MKKIVAFLFVLAMVISVLGCTASPEAQEPAAEEPVVEEAEPEVAEAPVELETEAEEAEEVEYKQYPDFKVAALLSGVITDNGWSANMYNAVMNLQDKYGVTSDYVESVAVSDMEEYLRGFANDGYGLVIAHGSQFIEAVNAVAPDFPDTMFAVSYATGTISEFDNVIGVAPIGQGILQGIVAGALTDTDKVAWLGSVENPSTTEDSKYFEPGVRLVNPDAEVVSSFIGSATDLDKGKEMTMNLIDRGFDVVTQQANQAGLGVIQACDEAGILTVGVNTDQYDVAPNAVVTSVLRNFPLIYETIFPQIAEGTLEGGTYPFKIEDGGTMLAPWHGWDEKLPPEKIKLIEDTIAGIKDGSIQVPY